MAQTQTSDSGHWQADSTAPNCTRCGKEFSLFRRRHHCRSCGYIFCDTCSPQRSAPRGMAGQGRRLCEQCVQTRGVPDAPASAPEAAASAPEAAATAAGPKSSALDAGAPVGSPVKGRRVASGLNRQSVSVSSRPSGLGDSGRFSDLRGGVSPGGPPGAAALGSAVQSGAIQSHPHLSPSLPPPMGEHHTRQQQSAQTVCHTAQQLFVNVAEIGRLVHTRLEAPVIDYSNGGPEGQREAAAELLNALSEVDGVEHWALGDVATVLNVPPLPHSATAAHAEADLALHRQEEAQFAPPGIHRTAPAPSSGLGTSAPDGVELRDAAAAGTESATAMAAAAPSAEDVTCC